MANLKGAIQDARGAPTLAGGRSSGSQRVNLERARTTRDLDLRLTGDPTSPPSWPTGSTELIIGLMKLDDRIVTDPSVLVGKPVIKGTRIAVEFVIELLARSWSEAQILENYPGLTREDIAACLAYAAERLKSERIYPVPTG